MSFKWVELHVFKGLLWLSSEDVCVVVVVVYRGPRCCGCPMKFVLLPSMSNEVFKGVRSCCLVKRSGCCLSWELGCCFSNKFRAVPLPSLLWILEFSDLRSLLPFFLQRSAACLSTTCASVPLRDWASRPSLRSAAGTGWNSAGIGRNWPDSDGTCHHQRAGQSPSARTRDRYFRVRPLTQKPRSNNWMMFSFRNGFSVRVLRAPRGFLSRRPIPHCSQFRPVPAEPGSCSARFRFVALYQAGQIARARTFFTAMSIS